jgi:hypothetical protein
VGLLAPLAAGTASAVELLEGKVTVGAAPVLQNVGGTVRLEQPQVNEVDRTTFFVPEPGALWQLGSGIGLLALLAGRRRRRTASHTDTGSTRSRRFRHAENKEDIMKKHFRPHASWLAILAMTLMTAPAFAEVPQYMTFSGRLVDDAGVPLVGEVAFELWIYDDPTGGNALYAEDHYPVTLDAQGSFSVLIGTGGEFMPGIPHDFDATLFSGADAYVGIVLLEPTFARLTPRVPLSSVPWALVAQQVAPWDPNATPRFEDCGDGTVADHQTGLQWEKKTGTWVSPGVYCDGEPCPDPHDVNNRYTWSSTGTDPDGNAFIDFLARLNAKFDLYNPTGCFVGRCDWRLPEISELQTILIGSSAAPGQANTCSAAERPCIDPGFAAVGGPTASWIYWSTSALVGSPSSVWTAYFVSGNVSGNNKSSDFYSRAVRAGSCH